MSSLGNPKKSLTQKTLNVWAIVLILWSIYRAKFKTDLPPWFDEFIAKPVVFILPLFYYIKKFEQGKFLEGIDLKFKNIKKDLVIGVSIGMVFFVSGIVGNIYKSQSLFNFSLVLSTTFLFQVGLSLATAFSEEALSRGFVLKRLYQDSRNIFSSAFLASILFFFLHVPILFTSDKIIGYLLLRVMFTDLILSLTVSFIYLERKSIVVPILIHTFYNLSLFLFV